MVFAPEKITPEMGFFLAQRSDQGLGIETKSCHLFMKGHQDQAAMRVSHWCRAPSTHCYIPADLSSLTLFVDCLRYKGIIAWNIVCESVTLFATWSMHCIDSAS